MHDSSMIAMKEFVTKYLRKKTKDTLEILDVGSWCKPKQESYKHLFQHKSWKYTGVDVHEGPNVDIVAPGLYDWGLTPGFYDVVISGQCLEHVKDSQKWMKEVAKYLKVGGIVCIIAPWQWRIHRYPVDCWRILPDGMQFLLEDIAKLDVLNVFVREFDCIGIAKKEKS